METYGWCTVRFLTAEGKLGSKDYIYLLDKELYNKLRNNNVYYVDAVNPFFNVYNIKNENGYDYRNAEVVIINVNYGLPQNSINYSHLSKVNFLRVSDILTYEVNNKKDIIEYNTIPSTISTTISNAITAVGTVSINLKESLESLDNLSNKETKIERKDNMFNKMFKNIEFGKVRSVKMSLYGPAFVDEDGMWAAYDKKSEEWIDVTDMTFEGMDMCYAMPAAKNTLKLGDYIKHNGDWVRIINFDNDLRPIVEKLAVKEVVTIIPTKNMFGFDYYTKLVCFGEDLFQGGASEANPFGMMLPLMMMGDKNNDDILPLILMMQNKDGTPSGDFNNPMMMYMMMKDNNSDSNLLPMLMMMNMNK